MSTAESLILNAQQTRQLVADFNREGCVVVPGLLTAEEAAEYRALTDGYVPDAGSCTRIESKHISWHMGTFVLRYCEELEPCFTQLAARPDIVQLVESILGAGATLNTINVIRNEKGNAIANWHVDDTLEFPLPPEIPRFDMRMTMPVFWMTVQIALTDIDSLDHGPTQYVPGSHYSGRRPPQENPQFESRGAVDVLCRKGDAYLTNHQTWHRGAPNQSERTRYVMQFQYSQMWIAARFQNPG